MMANPPAIEQRIESARARLAQNLGELQHRVTRARELLSPSTYLRSPWLKVGLGLAAGYLVVRHRDQKLLTSGGAAPVPAETGMMRSALRTVALSLAATVIERLVEHMIDRGRGR